MWEKLKSGIIFNKNPVKILLFSDSSISTMQKFIQNTNSKCEAGGIILGEVKGKHIYVTDVSSPKKNDIRKSTYFERKDKAHISFYEYRYNQNNCTKYFGEWHTHPEKQPTPSLTDKKEWNKICKMIKEPNIFLIIGTHNIYIEIKWNEEISLYTSS